MDTSFTLDTPLRAVGDILAQRGEFAAVVVVGGAALNLLGVVERATQDVDVIAIEVPEGAEPPVGVKPPAELPMVLVEAIAIVARDFGLPSDWLNTVVGMQWETGLPPGFEDRIEWRLFGSLWVGLPGRIDFVFLKLYAAADDVGPKSRHFKDLEALRPTEEELRAAAGWIRTQDPSPAMDDIVSQVISHVVYKAR